MKIINSNKSDNKNPVSEDKEVEEKVVKKTDKENYCGGNLHGSSTRKRN